MNRVFKNWANNKPVSLIKYILDYVQKYPDTKIYVGTDSQNSGLNTVYVTAVVLRQGLRGGHILYNYHKISIVKDFWSRLWRETELSLEIAQFISDNSPLQIEAIDLDYNDDEYEESNKLVAASKGFLTSYGYKSTVKPEAQIASKAADHIIRSENPK